MSRKIEAEAIRIDVSRDSASEFGRDLDRHSRPLESDWFSRIHMHLVMEHPDDPMRAMTEVYWVVRGSQNSCVDLGNLELK